MLKVPFLIKIECAAAATTVRSFVGSPIQIHTHSLGAPCAAPQVCLLYDKKKFIIAPQQPPATMKKVQGRSLNMLFNKYASLRPNVAQEGNVSFILTIVLCCLYCTE